MKKAVMYGAGNIGRGFIGQLFSESGYHVQFVDINKAVIDALNAYGRYTVGIVGHDSIESVEVGNVSGVIGTTVEAVRDAMRDADIMATALGVNVLPHIIGHLAAGVKVRIDEKRPLNIIICENLLNADKYLRQNILKALPAGYEQDFDRYIGLVEASIGRMVPVMEQSDDMLHVNVEPYGFLPVDRDAFVGGIPDIKNLYPFSPFGLFIRRKLFMHNMSHAMTAYLGQLKGYTYIYEAIGDSDIFVPVYSALVRSAEALAAEYRTDIAPLLAHASNLLYRFQNRNLKDTIARVGRDTKRKLSADDRLVGAVRLLIKHGISPDYHLAGIAAGLLFAPEGDEGSKEVSACAAMHGAAAALQRYAGLIDPALTERAAGFYATLLGGAPLTALRDACLAAENREPVL